MKLYIGVNTDDFILYKKGEIILIIIISQNRATRVATFEVCVRSPNACCITQVHYAIMQVLVKCILSLI